MRKTTLVAKINKAPLILIGFMLFAGESHANRWLKNSTTERVSNKGKFKGGGNHSDSTIPLQIDTADGKVLQYDIPKQSREIRTKGDGDLDAVVNVRARDLNYSVFKGKKLLLDGKFALPSDVDGVILKANSVGDDRISLLIGSRDGELFDYEFTKINGIWRKNSKHAVNDFKILRDYRAREVTPPEQLFADPKGFHVETETPTVQ